MLSTYKIDRIRKIAVWESGAADGLADTGLCEAGDQRCLSSVSLNGMEYPTRIVGDGRLPIMSSRWAFTGGMQQVSIPNGVIRIASNAFLDFCFDDDVSIELPLSLLEIGSEAFFESDKSHIVIPENVVVIGENAFPDKMEVECRSPYLIRLGDNVFDCKTYQPNGCPFEFRISNPLAKEVALCGQVSDINDTCVRIPDTVSIDGTDYCVTGIDSTFCDSCEYIEVVLPKYLRTIGNGALEYAYVNALPDSLRYVGRRALGENRSLRLPHSLRFIGGHDDSVWKQFTSLSPHIDLDNFRILGDGGEPLFFFGGNMSSDKQREINPKKPEGTSIYDKDAQTFYIVEEYCGKDYLDSYFPFLCDESLDSATF